jgi:PAS domain S-box-containing protein
MTPIRLSTSWYRRLYVAVGLMSLTYAVIYGLEVTSTLAIPAGVSVPLLAAITGGITAVASIFLAIFAHKISGFIPSLSVYLVFALTTAFVVQQSGGIDSFYLVFWVIAAVFAPVFGAYGWVPILALTGGYVAGLYVGNQLSIESGILTFLSSILPLAAGLIVWRDAPESDEHAAKSVKNLASQLSEVATTSEIVINAIGDGVIAVDGKGVIQLINPAGQELLGWGKQDALMLSYKSILKLADENNTDLDPSKDPIQQVLNTNQEARGNKLVAVTQSGKKISLSIVVSPIGDPGSGAIAVFRDTTNERAEEREQAEFISTASHEMRTPVASIEGYLGLALNPNTATIDTRAHDYIIKAHEAAQHLGRLFQDLLDVSKSEDGRMSNLPRVVDITAFTQTITQGLQQKAADKGLSLNFVPAGSDTVKKIMPVYFVNLDNDHIREVLDNLIENAIKYTPKGEVSIDVTGTDDTVTVSIKDTGLGIPPEDLPHLFQKFYRVENIDRQQIGGTGLGLYLCRRLVEAMQGRLWVESVFGQGSTFFVELPRVDTQEATRLKDEQDRQAAQAAAQAAAQPAPQPVAATPPIATTMTPAAPAPQPYTQPPVAPAPQPVATPTAPQQPSAPTQIPVTVVQSTPAAVPQAQDTPAAPGVRPATTVPRGESLTREQIAERVRQLEEMARQQREQAGQR